MQTVDKKTPKNGYFGDAYDVIRSFLLPHKEFRPFCDRKGGLHFPAKYRESAIADGEALLGKEYHLITASEYLMFYRSGDRDHFQKYYFERRKDLLTFLFAEVYEDQGRFMDGILNLTWAILEERSWYAL